MYIILSVIGIICFALGVGMMGYDVWLDCTKKNRDLEKTCNMLRMILILICLGNVLISFARLIK